MAVVAPADDVQGQHGERGGEGRVRELEVDAAAAKLEDDVIGARLHLEQGGEAAPRRQSALGARESERDGGRVGACGRARGRRVAQQAHDGAGGDICRLKVGNSELVRAPWRHCGPRPQMAAAPAIGCRRIEPLAEGFWFGKRVEFPRKCGKWLTFCWAVPKRRLWRH